MFEGFPTGRAPEGIAGRRKLQLATLIEPIEQSKEFSLKLIPEDMDRDKKFLPGPAYFMVGSQPAARNDTVHMDMVQEFLVPCMEYLYDTGRCPEMFLVPGQFQKRIGAASVEQPVEEFLVAVKQRVEFMWKRKNHVKVRGVNDFGPAPVHPYLFIDSLTVGAAAVTAGIIVDLDMPAIFADTDAVSERAGPAIKDSMSCFFLHVRLVMPPGTETVIRKQESLPNRIVRHCVHSLPAGQKDL